MSDITTSPAAAPVLAPPDTTTGSAPSGATGKPEAAAPASAPKLSTALLTEQITAQLRGETTTAPAAPPAGPETSPAPPTAAATPEETDPSPVPDPDAPPKADDDEPAPAGLSTEAKAALSEARKEKRQAKEALKLAQERIAELEKVKADPNAKPVQTPALTLPDPPELAQAREHEASQLSVLTWARNSHADLRKALRAGDATAVLAQLNAELAPHKAALPSDPDAALEQLESWKEKFHDGWTEARLATQVQAQQVKGSHAALAQESQAIAEEFVPEMFQAGTPEAKRAAQIAAHFPGIEQHPLGRRVMAAALLGWRQMEAKSGGAGAPAPAAPGKQAPKAGAERQAPPVLPARPQPTLPGASHNVPARPAPETPTDAQRSAFRRYNEAKPGPEKDRLKEEWQKTIGGSLANQPQAA